MKYICIKNFPGLGCLVNDIIDIERKENNKFLIDGACLTDKDIVTEFFKVKRLPGWKYCPYSFSKLDSWKQCPKRFEYTYIIKPEKEEVPTTTVHFVKMLTLLTIPTNKMFISVFLC